MAKVPKPDLDDTTIQIARRMLSAPPKPHEQMKIGKKKPRQPSHKRKKEKLNRN